MAKWEDLSFLEGGDIAGANYADMLSQAADKYGIPDKVPILQKILKVESGGNVNAKSPKGASGLMQLMPGTAKGLGVKNIFDPAENIDAGVRYFKQQLDTFGDDALALAAYNAGPGAVKKYGGIPPYKETQRYVKNILAPCQGDNCGDAVAKAINPYLPGKKLPLGGLGEGEILDVAKYYGSPVLRKDDISLESLQSLGPGTVIRMTRKPGDVNYKYGDTHAEMITLNPETQQLAVASFTSGKGMKYKPLTQEYINTLPKQVIATNLIGQNMPTNMVADVSGQTIPANVQNPQSPEKQQTISSILGDLASKIGPNEATAAEPPKKPLWEDLGDWEDLGINMPAQDNRSMGQKIAGTVAPYVRPAAEIGGAIAGGVIGSGGGPVGVAAGTGLGYGIGKEAANLVDQYAGTKQGPQTLTDVAGQTGQTLKESAMVGMGSEVGSKLAEPLMKWFAQRAGPALYERVMKMTTVPKSMGVDRGRAVQTGLEGKYAPTAQGLEKLEADKTALIGKIDDMIKTAAGQGKTIKTDAISNSLDDLSKYYENMPDPRPYLKAIEDAKTNILEYRGAEIPIDVAQKMKTTLYQTLKKAYGEMKNIDKEFDKTVARAIKEEIERVVPEIGLVNKELGDKLNLEKVLSRAVNRIRNHDLISLTDYIISGAAGTAGAVVGGTPAGFASALIPAVMKKILTSPYVQSHIAFMLNRLPQNISQGAMSKLAAIGLTKAGEGLSSKQSQQSLEPSFAH